MTEVCRYQEVCTNFEGRGRRAESAKAAAGIVNWIVAAFMFFGLVLIGNQVNTISKQAALTTELRNEQIKDLMEFNIRLEGMVRAQDEEIAKMLNVLSVSPKDVLPVVQRIESKVDSCGWKAAVP